MKIAVPRQSVPGETRAAVVPDVVKKLVGRGVEVVVEAGLGVGAKHGDGDYEQAGATVVAGGDDAALWGQADVVVSIHPPTAEQVEALDEGDVLIAMLAPFKHVDLVRRLAEKKITTFSLEFVPRITRAQAMDVLSSQASIGGYRAVMLAAVHCSKIFPMMMTAAGTIAPARVFVLGAGVAGLQAIATAKRLGAVVEAYDIRPAVKEEVQSLGARFVELPTTKADAQVAGGYAREQTAEERQQQADLMAKHIAAADCVVSTAAVFGKAPPMLIPGDVVRKMRAGAVVIDMAADADAGRGNCELTKPGECYTTDQGVVIDGPTNLPAQAPVHASQMYAANLLSFLNEIIKSEKGQGEAPPTATLVLNLEDEIQKGALITHGGEVVNERVKAAM